MYFSTALLGALPVILSQVAAEPLPTPAPIPHASLIRDAMFRRSMMPLQKRSDLHFCYGDGSICEASIDLYDRCKPFSNQADLTQHYQCICENGWVSTSQACNWCDTYYNIPDVDINSLNTAECSSHSFTVAPIPSSILVAQSQYNATQTNPPTGGPNTGGGGGKPTGSSNKPAASTSAGVTGGAKSTGASIGVPKQTSQVTSSTFTLNGGAGSLLPASTLPPLVTNNALPSPTSTLRSGGDSGSGSGGGAASGLNTMSAMVFSLTAFGGAMWCLMVAGMW